MFILPTWALFYYLLIPLTMLAYVYVSLDNPINTPRGARGSFLPSLNWCKWGEYLTFFLLIGKMADGG